MQFASNYREKEALQSIHFNYPPANHGESLRAQQVKEAKIQVCISDKVSGCCQINQDWNVKDFNFKFIKLNIYLDLMEPFFEGKSNIPYD